jgi:predicted  nucleic acid-binding Zn-ribbon protein
MSRVSSLYRLQSLDHELDAARERLGQIEATLASSPEVTAARQRADAAQAALREAHRTLTAAEAEVGTQQNKIRETERRLYSGEVQSPKELKDLENDAASLKRYLTVLEDRQLQVMVAEEEAEGALSKARASLAEAEGARGQQEGELGGERAGLLATVERLEAQREAAIALITPEDIDTYDGLRRTRRGTAVARLDGTTCSRCGVAPSQARIDAARTGEDIVMCGNCGRILYTG